VSKPHRRFISSKKVQLRERPDGALPAIHGYAAVFHRDGDPGTEFAMWPGAVERIKPGAFDRAIGSDDVRALYNHNPSQVLGRASAGTLRLSVDAVGLRYEIDPPDTQLARDLVESIRRGDVTGSSFAFMPRGEAGTVRAAGENGVTYYDRTDVELFDVGPVTYPAYGAADSAVRAAIQAERESEAERVAADRVYASRVLAATEILSNDAES
jgi:HK97 family phage prohead protease